VLVQGDITAQEVDAVVNAANSSLMGGGGVDGAIHRAGGPAILEECRAIVARQGPLPPGQAVVTTAGNMKARWVVHTVGPVWQGGQRGEPDLLRACYRASLQAAADQGARSVAFPSISTGAFGYPIEQAAPLALRACRDFARQDSRLREIRFVLFSDRDLAVYRRALAELEKEESGG
jgi:O-acetyl-ADP-ribose deacetylase (regulator of RNase III)